MNLRRRTLLRNLVAIGGAASLAACLDLTDSEDVPSGTPARRPERQHAWNRFLPVDEHGTHRLPRHHVFLSLNYRGSDSEEDPAKYRDDDREEDPAKYREEEPEKYPEADREKDREVFESALLDLETAFEASQDGLLLTVGYAPEYFDRLGRSLDSVDVPPAGPLVPGENVGIDDADVLIHLASDHASAVLEAEEALFGDERANGREVTSIDGLFERSNRRTGFLGRGMPAERDSNVLGVPSGAVHDDAPSYMNFRSGLAETQATEDRVTIQAGRFAGGTTMHVSVLRLQLSEWFEHTPDEQIARLFAPELDVETVGAVGEELTGSNSVDAVDRETLESLASEHGVVGHAQKLSRFRENGRPPILRRDVNTDDHREAGVVFVSLQRAFEDFRTLRLAMEGSDVVGVGGVRERKNNGILEYFQTRRRGNYLVPPRSKRAFPA